MNSSAGITSLPLSSAKVQMQQDEDSVSQKKFAEKSMAVLSRELYMISYDFCKEEMCEKLLKDYQVEEFISGGLWTCYESRIYKARDFKTDELFALSVVSLVSPFHRGISPESRLRKIDQEIRLSKEIPSEYATQTYKRIDMPKSRLVALIKELADCDIYNMQCEIDDHSFVVMIRQCLELYHYLDVHGYYHCEYLDDILYFKSQGRIKLSSLETVTPLNPGMHNELHEITQLISNVAGLCGPRKRERPDWMSEASYRFACDFLDGRYKTAGDALQTEIMKSVIGLPLILELKKSNFEEVTGVKNGADEDS